MSPAEQARAWRENAHDAEVRASVKLARRLLKQIPPVNDDDRWYAQGANNYVSYYAFLSAFAVRVPLGLRTASMALSLARLGEHLALVRRQGVTS